ncbi:hypothetical protein [Sphingomonas profundi]|uniref:hypothetical protein n=1 Tax=Alterirhizorhabdus profundi TaxID=2681549 RepID=UPI0018D05423|nr:hypothetical protein [Sphingomonas profundi]
MIVEFGRQRSLRDRLLQLVEQTVFCKQILWIPLCQQMVQHAREGAPLGSRLKHGVTVSAGVHGVLLTNLTGRGHTAGKLNVLTNVAIMGPSHRPDTPVAEHTAVSVRQSTLGRDLHYDVIFIAVAVPGTSSLTGLRE